MCDYAVVIPTHSQINLHRNLWAIHNHQIDAHVIPVLDRIKPLDSPPDLLHIEYVQGATPFIFARNINRGIIAAGRKDVIVVNDDAILATPGGFDLLRHASKGMGIVSASVAGIVGNPNQQARPGNQLRLEPKLLCFICVYIPRSTIDRVGLLDEKYIGYGYEDNDYSDRVLGAGLKLGVLDSCIVAHGHLKSEFRDHNRGTLQQLLDTNRRIYESGTTHTD